MFTNEQIANYYDECEIHYRKNTHLEKTMAMHYGYWDHTTKNLADAMINTNKVLLRKAKIVKNDFVLDAGCGVGGSSIYLAKNIGCKVIGVTLSEKQVKTAKNYARQHGVSDLVDFKKQDYTATDFKDNTFDVVWGLETVCIAANKFKFLQEAYRILKPGGRLIMIDPFKKAVIENPNDIEIVRRWLHGWLVNDLETFEDFLEYLKSVGFERIDAANSTENIKSTSKRLYCLFFPGIIAVSFRQLFTGRDALKWNNLWSCYYQYVALKRRLWECFIILAYKPKSV